MKPLKFAVVGAGFWSQFQLAAWHELDGLELVAVCDPDLMKARKLASRFGIEAAYSSADKLFEKQELDFVDIISPVETHAGLVKMAASRGIDVICQKPMATSFAEAEEMVRVAEKSGISFFVHENFRWQAPIRQLWEALASGVIGKPFKARLSFCSAFPVFKNQPALAELKHFIIADVGSHTLDLCRFLFGEAKSLFCLTSSVNPGIKGEDVANILLEMENGLHCFVEMSYASLLEKESFPQTLVLVEGEKGSIHLSHDYELKVTTSTGTHTTAVEPKLYSWADPAYAVVHASIVDCNRNILKGLRGDSSETTGADNLKTAQLVWSCYESAALGKTLRF